MMIGDCCSEGTVANAKTADGIDGLMEMDVESKKNARLGTIRVRRPKTGLHRFLAWLVPRFYVTQFNVDRAGVLLSPNWRAGVPMVRVRLSFWV